LDTKHHLLLMITIVLPIEPYNIRFKAPNLNLVPSGRTCRARLGQSDRNL